MIVTLLVFLFQVDIFVVFFEMISENICLGMAYTDEGSPTAGGLPVQ